MQYEPSASLPEPDKLSEEHSARVREHVCAKIERAGGQISFADYMHEILYAPGLGYYSAGSSKFGPAGDFITAPEVSSIFGTILARQVAEVLQQIDGASILEFGAGSGKLAADMLESLQRLDALPSTYNILEVSADLRERQESYLRQRVPDLVDRVAWLASPPTAMCGALVANEVLDALPVERFVRRDSGVMQVRVTVTNNGFEFVEEAAPGKLRGSVAAIEEDLGARLPEGYVSEICLAVPGLIEDMSAALREGVAFVFDYGVPRREYYAAERNDGWLRCHFRHHAHNDPLILPGIQDLTAWVDFTAVAAAAVAAGFEIGGYSAQAQFLMAGGLDAEMGGFADLSLEEQIELSRQVKTLTLPGEMGEHFKCIALQKGNVATPSGFSIADRTHTL